VRRTTTVQPSAARRPSARSSSSRTRRGAPLSRGALLESAEQSMRMTLLAIGLRHDEIEEVSHTTAT
jgi:hypothetical protein